MDDQRPLRQEDYLAMSERLKRAEEERDSLIAKEFMKTKAKPKPTDVPKDTVDSPYMSLDPGVIVFMCIVGFGAFLMNGAIQLDRRDARILDAEHPVL